MTDWKEIDELRWLELTEYKRWRITMAAIDDLNTAVEANTAATTAAVAAFASADNSEAIEAAVTALDANNTALEGLVPAPAPAPAPPATS